MRKFYLNQRIAGKIFFGCLISVFIILQINYYTRGFKEEQKISHWNRRLQLFPGFGFPKEIEKKCERASSGAVEEFPADFFTKEQRYRGAIIIHILVMCYTFGLLAVVCDDYFVLSLYHICSRLRLDKDVAGATFMAIGSSAPTLFIAIVSIFFTENASDVGLGTVVGSTIFNTLFIIGVCSMATSVPLRVSCWPLMRDSFVYSIGTFTLVATVKDRKVFWYEAIIFVFIYLFYIIIMCFNRPLGRIFNKYSEQCCGACGEIEEDDDSDAGLLDQTDTFESKKSEEKVVSEKGLQTTLQNHSEDSLEQMKNELAQFEHKQDSPIKVPPGCLPKITWVLGFPVMILFYITIPPCCKQRWSEWFLVTFAMSVIWMGALSYVLVWMVCVIGDTFDIPDCIMGMTFLAAGSSIPDVMASVIVVRQGMADMAISNAIGSNVFDMLCLGIPWLLKTTVLEPGSFVQIESQSIMISSLLLIGSIVFTIIAIYLNNWRLDFKLGLIFLLVYIVFIMLATLLEFLACPCQFDDFINPQ